jgi:hypothetical protein
LRRPDKEICPQEPEEDIRKPRREGRGYDPTDTQILSQTVEDIIEEKDDGT